MALAPARKVWRPVADGDAGCVTFAIKRPETGAAAGVLLQNCDATLADRDNGLVVARHAIVSDHALQWPEAITAAEKASAIAQLKALGVLVRQGV